MDYHMLRQSLVLVIVSIASLASLSTAQDWPRFRGPNGSGVSDATTVPTKWTDNDYNWQIDLPGAGHSSPVVLGDLLVVTCGVPDNGARIVLALEAISGKERWRKTLHAATHRAHKLNSSASATQSLDADNVYTCWTTPDSFLLMALDHQGHERWRVNLGTFKAGHGDGVSPIVHGNFVIVPKEHEGESEIVALDRSTGKVTWRVPRRSRTTWATPCVFRNGAGESELIFSSYEHGITSLRPNDGKLNWEADVFSKEHFESTIGSPIVAGDLVLGMSGYLAVRQEVIAVRPAGRAMKIAKPIYTLDRGAPLCTTPLVIGELLFLWADEGIVSCANAHSGELHWQKRVGGKYYASPVALNGHVYNVSTDGTVVVVAAHERYSLISRMKLGQGSHSTPAVANGVMYLRTFSKLFSIGGESDGT